MTPWDLFPVDLEDPVIHRWSRRVVLGAAVLGVLLFADLQSVSTRLFLSVVLLLWLACEGWDLAWRRRKS